MDSQIVKYPKETTQKGYSLIKEAIKSIQYLKEELSKIAGMKRGYNTLISNRAIPLFYR